MRKKVNSSKRIVKQDLLLHTCCADCMLKIVNANESTYNFVLYMYNPNIHPRSEYSARLEALKKVSEERGLKLSVADWSPKEYFGAVISSKNIESKNLTTDFYKKELRCGKCWRVRLEKSFQYATQKNILNLSTTLLSSKYQDSEMIVKIGESLSKKYQINFISDLKIEGDIENKGFYKQNYCGCVYSLNERYEEKFLTS